MVATLIATLGSEPQVIAIGAQLLLARGVALSGVVALHTRPHIEPISTSLRMLEANFAAHPEWPPLRTVLIPTRDVLSPSELDTYAEVLYRTLKESVSGERTIHLLLAGGRKPMAMVGLTVAQLLLSSNDNVWYLISDESLRSSGRFALCAGDRAELTPIPLANLGTASPRFTSSFLARTPEAARRELSAQRNRQIQAFLEQGLTPAEREVASLAAREVLTVKEMATRLYKSPKTVSNQLNSVYSKMEIFFGLQPDLGVKREFLRRELRPYLDRENLKVRS